MNTKVKKISFLLILVLFFSFTTITNGETIAQTDSMYKYNALENKVFFVYMENGVITPTEEILKLTEDAVPNTEILNNAKKRQADSIKQSEDSIKIIENANGIKSFLVGNNLDILAYQIVQMNFQIYNLNVLSSKTDSIDIKTQIDILIETLNKEKERVESFIIKSNSQFNLLSWLASLI